MKNNEYGQGAPSKADAAMSNDKCPKCGGVLRPADWHLADGVYCLERQLTQLRADKARLQGIVLDALAAIQDAIDDCDIYSEQEYRQGLSAAMTDIIDIRQAAEAAASQVPKVHVTVAMTNAEYRQMLEKSDVKPQGQGESDG